MRQRRARLRMRRWRRFDREAAILSAWQPQSEFSRWARTRFEAVPVSAELLETLAAFDKWRERTEGALDPSVEAATRLWQSAAAEGRVPTDAEIAQTVEAIQQPHWSLDAANGTATRLSETPLALATFAKSRITAKAANAALAAGASGVMLNVGGDVVVRGALTQVVAVADPQRSAENDPAMDFVVVSNAAVATSGGYRRGFGSYSHLIDPKTATPVSHVLSSTVIARDAETAGALATAFSVMPVAREPQAGSADSWSGIPAGFGERPSRLRARTGPGIRHSGDDGTLVAAAFAPAPAGSGGALESGV